MQCQLLTHFYPRQNTQSIAANDSIHFARNRLLYYENMKTVFFTLSLAEDFCFCSDPPYTVSKKRKSTCRPLCNWLVLIFQGIRIVTFGSLSLCGYSAVFLIYFLCFVEVSFCHGFEFNIVLALQFRAVVIPRGMFWRLFSSCQSALVNFPPFWLPALPWLAYFVSS